MVVADVVMTAVNCSIVVVVADVVMAAVSTVV